MRTKECANLVHEFTVNSYQYSPDTTVSDSRELSTATSKKFGLSTLSRHIPLNKRNVLQLCVISLFIEL
jgi:hypothetical protein